MTLLRQGLLRYSYAFSKPNHVIFMLSMEESDSSITNADGLHRYPDFCTRLDLNYDWGHLSVKGVARELGAESTSGGGKDFKWTGAGSLAGKILMPTAGGDKPGVKDDLKFEITAGSPGRYIIDLLRAGGQEGIYVDATKELTPLTQFGGFAAYHHCWTDKWRSNIIGGYVRVFNVSAQGPDALRETIYGQANLIYRPFKKFDVGVSYYHGRRVNHDHSSGYANRMMFSLKYFF
jgi:hypothetical protein